MKIIATVFAASLLLAPILPASSLQESNKSIAKLAFDEILNKGNFAVADVYYDKDFRNHGLHGDATFAEDQTALKGWHQAFSDIEVQIRKMIAEGDLVTVYWVAQGTNTGSGNGLPATGKKVEVSGITIWRIVNGKIKEEWSSCDELAMYQQLGLIASQDVPL